MTTSFEIGKRAAVQVDQWDHIEGGNGPDLEHLEERASTLINILRELVRVIYPCLSCCGGWEPPHVGTCPECRGRGYSIPREVL